jgi:hypothetical protein
MARPPAAHSRRAWSAEEDAALRAVVAAGRSLNVLAGTLNRSSSSVHSRVHALGLGATRPAPPREAVLALLQQIAAAGEACPGDREMARRLDRAVNQVQEALVALAADGVITVEGPFKRRIITLSDGRSTRRPQDRSPAGVDAPAVVAFVTGLITMGLAFPGLRRASATLGVSEDRLRRVLDLLRADGQLIWAGARGVPVWGLPDGRTTAVPAFAFAKPREKAPKPPKAPKAPKVARPARPRPAPFQATWRRVEEGTVSRLPPALDRAITDLRRAGYPVFRERKDEKTTLECDLWRVGTATLDADGVLARAAQIAARAAVLRAEWRP